MRLANIFGPAIAAAALTAAAIPAAAKPPAGQRPVMRVVQASIIPLRKPGSVLICARGRVGSTGWTNATLTPRVYIAPPPGGIWEVDFTAKPPSEIVPQVVRPISARRVWAAPGGMRGVRIVSRTNSIVARLGSRRSIC